MFYTALAEIQPNAYLNQFTTAYTVMDFTSRHKLNYCQLLKDPKHAKEWNIPSGNEFGCLAQGKTGRVKSTNTIFLSVQKKYPPTAKNYANYSRFQ